MGRWNPVDGQRAPKIANDFLQGLELHADIFDFFGGYSRFDVNLLGRVALKLPFSRDQPDVFARGGAMEGWVIVSEFVPPVAILLSLSK
jgi:hypothetical protein